MRGISFCSSRHDDLSVVKVEAPIGCNEREKNSMHTIKSPLTTGNPTK